jgi:UDP-N-acetylglucosamine 2-epimerase
MAGGFFAELGLPRPDVSLGVGGGTHAEQTGRMLRGLESVLAERRPDAVVIYGDTNSTLAGALAEAKAVVPLAHVEAGLRSFDRRMPEEINRVLVDHLASWLFAPTPTAVANLRAEGISAGIHLVGDVMQDLAARVVPEIRDPAVLVPIEAFLRASSPGLRLEPGGYLFATVHRAQNREPDAVRDLVMLLDAVAGPGRPVVFAVHPGTRVTIEREGLATGPHVACIEPQSYRTSLALQLHAAAVLTDSGGIQREAAWLGVPCLVLRDRTEWLEALADSAGRMVLVGLDPLAAREALDRLAPSTATRDTATRAGVIPPSGAAELIAASLA